MHLRLSLSAFVVAFVSTISSVSAQQSQQRWCEYVRPMKNRNAAVFITVPDKTQWSDKDTFPSFAHATIPTIRQQVISQLNSGAIQDSYRPGPPFARLGLLSDPESGWELAADEVQPTLHFHTMSYNVFAPIDDLADELCELLSPTKRWGSGDDENKEIWVLSAGYGAKIVSKMVTRCENRDVFHNVRVFEEEDNRSSNFVPSASWGAKYPWGKFDVYKYRETEELAQFDVWGSVVSSGLVKVFPSASSFSGETSAVLWSTRPEERFWFTETFDQLSRSVTEARFSYFLRDEFAEETARYRYLLSLYLSAWATNIKAREPLVTRTVEVQNSMGEVEQHQISCEGCYGLWDGLFWFIDTDCAAHRAVSRNQFQVYYSAPSINNLPLPPVFEESFRLFEGLFSSGGSGGAGGGRPAPVCGDSQIKAPEECDPPVPNLCDASCKRISFCPNGRVDSGEECEQGQGNGENPACALIAKNNFDRKRRYTVRCVPNTCKCEFELVREEPKPTATATFGPPPA